MWQLHWATSSMTGMAAQAEESEKIAQRLQQEKANSEDRREFGTISIYFWHGFAQVLDRYCWGIIWAGWKFQRRPYVTAYVHPSILTHW